MIERKFLVKSVENFSKHKKLDWKFQFRYQEIIKKTKIFHSVMTQRSCLLQIKIRLTS